MNSCILMAQIIQDPELRYTADSQTPIAQMLVEFPSQRAEDPPARLRVVGWGNLANSIKENYALGDRVVIEGRLGMNTVERSEGFKEKRAELTVSRIYKLGGSHRRAAEGDPPPVPPSGRDGAIGSARAGRHPAARHRSASRPKRGRCARPRPAPRHRVPGLSPLRPRPSPR